MLKQSLSALAVVTLLAACASTSSSSASATVKQSGFSQTTWIPAFSAALQISKCVPLGVAIETACTPSWRATSISNSVR